MFMVESPMLVIIMTIIIIIIMITIITFEHVFFLSHQNQYWHLCHHPNYQHLLSRSLIFYPCHSVSRPHNWLCGIVTPLVANQILHACQVGGIHRERRRKSKGQLEARSIYLPLSLYIYLDHTVYRSIHFEKYRERLNI